MTHSQEETTGQKVRKYRSELKMSQSQLADGNCTVSAISQIESDKIRPTMELLAKLADRLKIDISYLVDVSEFAVDMEYLFSYTKVLIKKQQYTEALRTFEDLHNVSQTQQYTIRLLRAECHMRLGDQTLAVDQLNELVEEIQHDHSLDYLTLQAHKALGTAYYLQQDMIKSYHHYQVAYSLSFQFNKIDPTIVADLMQNLGLVCNNIGKYGDAKSYLLMAHEIYEKVADVRSLANTYYELGISTRQTHYMDKALELYENLEIVRMANMVRQYHAFHIMAIENYHQAIEELLDCSDQVYHLDDKDLSLYMLSKALEVAVTNRDHSNAQNLLDMVQNRLEELDSPHQGHLAYHRRVIGQYFLLVENHEKAFENLNCSAEMFGKMGRKEDASDSYELIADSFFERGLYKEAHEYQSKATKLLRKPRM